MPLLFAIFPSYRAVASDESVEQIRWIEETAESLGLTTVSLPPALRASEEAMDVIYLLPEDGHPNPLGYRIAAGALVQNADWGALSHGRCSH